MGKYQKLGHFLRAQERPRIALTFAEIERIIEGRLPPSAYKYRPWWSNNASNSVMTRQWLAAGFRTQQVDLAGKRLVFVRAPTKSPALQMGFADPPAPFLPQDEKAREHPLLDALKGSFTVAPDCDLTEPAMPEWAAARDADYGKGAPP